LLSHKMTESLISIRAELAVDTEVKFVIA
jgi:hypothetical protein